MIKQMKKPVFRPFSIRRGLLAAALGGAMVLDGTTSARADSNVATLSNGAAVVYSAPLSHGATANTIINTRAGRRLSFTRHAGGSLVAIDLGKSYTVASVSLKLPPHVSVDVFVVSSEPGPNSSWAQAIAGLAPAAVCTGSKPAAVNNLSGEYVVFDFGGYTGPFSDLAVMGVPLVTVTPAVASDVIGLHDVPGVNMTPLSEIPIASP